MRVCPHPPPFFSHVLGHRLMRSLRPRAILLSTNLMRSATIATECFTFSATALSCMPHFQRTNTQLNASLSAQRTPSLIGLSLSSPPVIQSRLLSWAMGEL